MQVVAIDGAQRLHNRRQGLCVSHLVIYQNQFASSPSNDCEFTNFILTVYFRVFGQMTKNDRANVLWMVNPQTPLVFCWTNGSINMLSAASLEPAFAIDSETAEIWIVFETLLKF